MPPTLEISDPLRVVEITSPGELTISHGVVIAFLQNLDDLHRAAKITTFTVMPAVEEGAFIYRFVGVDGRVWEQTMRILPGEAEMIFQISDYWKLSEFEPNRNVRLNVIEMLEQHGVTLIEATWL